MLRHILIKLTKIKHKERILKAGWEEQQETLKGTAIWLTADLPAETLQGRREWQDIFKVLKGKKKVCNQDYLHGKDHIWSWWQNKKFYRQAKVKKI